MPEKTVTDKSQTCKQEKIRIIYHFDRGHGVDHFPSIPAAAAGLFLRQVLGAAKEGSIKAGLRQRINELCLETRLSYTPDVTFMGGLLSDTELDKDIEAEIYDDEDIKELSRRNFTFLQELLLAFATLPPAGQHNVLEESNKFIGGVIDGRPCSLQDFLTMVVIRPGIMYSIVKKEQEGKNVD